MSKLSLFVVCAVTSSLVGTRTARAGTTVNLNVNTVAGLYSVFRTADANPSNSYNVQLASGIYQLPCAINENSSANNAGALKLRKGHIRLTGAGADQNAAANFVIDGQGAVNHRCSSFFIVGPAPGSGVASSTATLDIQGLTLRNAHSTGSRSGIELYKASSFTMSFSHVTGVFTTNSPGGAIEADQAFVSVSTSQIDNCAAGRRNFSDCGGGVVMAGGAMYLSRSSAEVMYSSFIDNWACAGGAVFFTDSRATDQLTVTNSTFSHNTAISRGGAIYGLGSGSISLKFNTIAQNAAATEALNSAVGRFGGGIGLERFNGFLGLRGNIIAGNTARLPFFNGSTAIFSEDCFTAPPAPSITDVYLNLIGKQGNCTFAPVGPLVGSNSSPLDPRLGPLQSLDMTWPGTLTMFGGLNRGSLCIGAFVDSGSELCVGDDERGVLRPSDHCDLGSYQTCVHDMCIQGVRLEPACDPCVEQICAFDSYCCGTQWDGVCVNEVGQICGLTCP